MIDGEHLRGEQFRAVAANEHLHGLVAHFLPDLMNISFGDQVSAGDQDNAIGDAVNLIENVAGDQQMHSLTAKLFEERNGFGARHGIQSVQRLIEDQHAWMMRDGLREPNLLPHAFAVAGDLAACCIAKLHAFEASQAQIERRRFCSCRGASGYP
jgi:hypothetical protein